VSQLTRENILNLKPGDTVQMEIPQQEPQEVVAVGPVSEYRFPTTILAQSARVALQRPVTWRNPNGKCVTIVLMDGYRGFSIVHSARKVPAGGEIDSPRAGESICGDSSPSDAGGRLPPGDSDGAGLPVSV